jgi:hypothetical protein
MAKNVATKRCDFGCIALRHKLWQLILKVDEKTGRRKLFDLKKPSKYPSPFPAFIFLVEFNGLSEGCRSFQKNSETVFFLS